MFPPVCMTCNIRNEVPSHVAQLPIDAFQGNHLTEHDLPAAPVGRAGQCHYQLLPFHLSRSEHGADHSVDDNRQPRARLNTIA